MYEQSDQDKQAILLTKLKLRLDKHSQQLTQSINYYNQVSTELTNLVKNEAILPDIVYHGFKTGGVKRIMLERFAKRQEINQASLYTDIDDQISDNNSTNSASLSESMHPDFLRKRVND